MNRMAKFRQAKKEEGFVQQNVWLAPEEQEIVDRQATKTGMTKAEVIRMALRKAYTQDGSMNVAG